jgi:predicted lipoprotein with Yx(FWY)xxD motif
MKRTVTATVSALAATLILTGCNAEVPSYAVSGKAIGAAPKPAGKLTTELVAKKVPRMGDVVTDSKGWILYRFDADQTDPSRSTCIGKCAAIWPPVLIDDLPELKGVPGTIVGSAIRDDSGLQVTLNGWPLYRYAGDKTPGQWKGQNVAGKWFVVSKTGKKNLTLVPPISKAVSPPKADTADTSTESTPSPTPDAPDPDATDPDTGDGADSGGGYSSGY